MNGADPVGRLTNGASPAKGPEVADVFRTFGPAYRESHRLALRFFRAMRDIERCRTAELGGHVDECDRCGHVRISYNSCRNRHCPKCQSLKKEKWLAARRKELLPVPYFHIVFTIPDALNPLARVNQRVLYGILFKAAAETLLELGRDPQHLGADIGLIAVLHTWGQNLMDHPHLHCIVAGGGLSPDGRRWVASGENFFIAVRVLSRLFRGKFLFYLRKAYREERLQCVGKTERLGDKKAFDRLVDQLYHKEWVVYSKPPFGGAAQVLEYLGRYTHRVAISNHRIVKLEGGRVTFRWRDYADGNRTKYMTLDAFEFIRRFLLHVLPHGFYKIRTYGILSNRNRRTKLERSKEILGPAVDSEPKLDADAPWEEWLLELTGIDVKVCPICQKGRMRRKEILQPALFAPT